MVAVVVDGCSAGLPFCHFSTSSAGYCRRVCLYLLAVFNAV